MALVRRLTELGPWIALRLWHASFGVAGALTLAVVMSVRRGDGRCMQTLTCKPDRSSASPRTGSSSPG